MSEHIHVYRIAAAKDVIVRSCETCGETMVSKRMGLSTWAAFECIREPHEIGDMGRARSGLSGQLLKEAIDLLDTYASPDKDVLDWLERARLAEKGA